MRQFSLILLIFHFSLNAQISVEQWVCPEPLNNFRGISAPDTNSVWLSSDQSQVWHYTIGTGWENRSPKGYEGVMWRDIEAFDEKTALILSAGSPGLVLRTSDAGRNWMEVFRDDDPKIFFDAFDFIDSIGRAFSDAQGNYIGLIETRDWGKTWHKWNGDTSALRSFKNQGGFAASGTCLKLVAPDETLIVLGGPEASFKRFTENNSIHRKLPLDFGEPSKGAFSISFKNSDTLIAVGGDYRADSLSAKSVALSYDGGEKWFLATDWTDVQNFYWSSVDWTGNKIVLSSRFKTAISLNNGESWDILPNGFYSFDRGWFSGPNGKLARLVRAKD